MDWSNKFPSPKFRKRYEEKCFKHFMKLRSHDDCRIRYQIYYDDIKTFYYYDDDEYLTLIKTLIYLGSF